MYNSFINTGFKQSKIFNIAGIRKLYLIKNTDIVNMTFVGKRILYIATASKFYEYDIKNVTYNFNVEKTKSGTIYTPELSFVVPSVDTFKTNSLNRLLNTELAAIVEDKNGLFWLVGQKQGLETNYSVSIDNDSNSYSVKMKNRQIDQPYEVTKAAIDSLLIETIVEVNSGTDYFLSNSQTNVLVNSHSTRIYLPDLPYDNQQHLIYSTFTDSSDIEVDGNGNDINDDFDFTMTSTMKAVIFTYTGIRWETEIA